MSSFDLILFPYKIHLKSRKINLGLTSSRKTKSKDESALVRTLNPATPGHSGRKPVQGPWVLAVRTGCPACPGHRLPPPPPPLTLRTHVLRLAPHARSPAVPGDLGATSSCRLPVSEMDPTPLSADRAPPRCGLATRSRRSPVCPPSPSLSVRSALRHWRSARVCGRGPGGR